MVYLCAVCKLGKITIHVRTYMVCTKVLPAIHECFVKASCLSICLRMTLWFEKTLHAHYLAKMLKETYREPISTV